MALILNRFAALNEDPPSPDTDGQGTSSGSGSEDESSSSSNALDPGTLQDHCHALYNKALALYGGEDYEAAAVAFQQVLESKFVTKASFCQGEVSKKLLFNTTKYLGLCHGHRGDHEGALPLLLKAYTMDSADINLSFKIGVIACKLGGHRLPLARSALENALTLSPNHWPCLDLLVTITFQLRDMQTCLIYIDRALRRDPSFTKGLMLRKAILKEEPNFKVLCPDGPHIGDDSALPEVNMNFPSTCVISSARDEDDYHTVSVGDVPWAEFLDILLEEYRQLQAKRLVPMFVGLSYKKTRPDPVEVSVQNVVQEMVDIVSGPSAVYTMTGQIVEDILDAALEHSSSFLVSTILLEVIESAVSTAVQPSKAKNAFVAAFMREVPLDLLQLEIRRSARVKLPADSQMEEMNKCEEMTAQALLESFIPASLTKKASADVGTKTQRLHEDRCNRRAESVVFPTEATQAAIVHDFVTSCPEVCLEEIMYLALLDVCRKCQSPWPAELRRRFTEVYVIWRDSFQLPDELSQTVNIEYLDVMMLANEILVESVKEAEPEEESELEEFIEDDLLHFRLSYYKLTQHDTLRVCYMEHQYRMAKKQVDEALYYGRMLENLLNDLDTVGDDDTFHASAAIDRQSLCKTLSYLENSKILHKVQEYYDDHQFQKVVDILSQTIDMRQTKIDEDDTWFMRLFMLIESLWHLDSFEACLDRCALALSKLLHTENLTDILNILNTIDGCLQMMESQNASNMSPATAASLCESLVVILLGQINGTLGLKSTLPWVIFYKILQIEEAKSTTDAMDENGIPHSVHFLASAHDYTGQLALCTDNGGQLLLALVSALTPLLKETTKVSSFLLESIKKNLDQAMYCLYCHPSKKSKAKYLVDHGVSPLALKWDKCSVMYKVVQPQKLPEFDDYKSSSITSDTEGLLKRFVALVPDEFNLQERMDKIEEYFSTDTKEFPKFSQQELFPKDMLDVFYLLGDYNFKSSNFAASIPYFRQDLSFNSHRLDSYVQMALAAANGIEAKLSQSYSDDIGEILKESRGVLKIFKECHKKNGSHATIFIESANFAFIINAFCSRVIKGEANNLSLDQFTALEKYKHDCLEFSDFCYSEAFRLLSMREDPNAVDERWLVHFFRGKIIEKQSQDIESCLREYLNAMKNLRAQGEHIPKKIAFSLVTDDLSNEFLEIYYRFHASILKLELQPGFKPSGKLIVNVSRLLGEVTELDVFDAAEKKCDPTSSSSADPAEADSEPPSKKVRLEEDLVTWEDITVECLAALERVKTVYAHHYKALHMLALYYMGDHAKHSTSKAREYLLGSSSSTAASSNKQPTLFGDRKASNLFNGIWRSPVAELERAGSFPTHVAKCVTVLFNMLRETEDYTIFLEAVTILKKSVDGDKKYLFDKDRQAFHTEACSSLIQILNAKADRYAKQGQAADEATLKFCMELFQTIRGKKPLPRSCNDHMRLILKKLYCSMFNRSDATFDEVSAFLQRMCMMEKNWVQKEIQPEDIARILSGGASSMMPIPESGWSQIILGGDVPSILTPPKPPAAHASSQQACQLIAATTLQQLANKLAAAGATLQMSSKPPPPAHMASKSTSGSLLTSRPSSATSQMSTKLSSTGHSTSGPARASSAGSSNPIHSKALPAGTSMQKASIGATQKMSMKPAFSGAVNEAPSKANVTGPVPHQFRRSEAMSSTGAAQKMSMKASLPEAKPKVAVSAPQQPKSAETKSYKESQESRNAISDANLQLREFQQSLSRSLFSQDDDDDDDVICID